MSGRASRRHRKARRASSTYCDLDTALFFTIECPHCNAPSRVSGDNARYLVEAIDAGDTIEFICTVCRGHLDVDQAGVRAA